MRKLLQGKPVTTRSPLLSVAPGLPPGRHRFQLVVIDSNGNRSAADAVIVEVRKAGSGMPRRNLAGQATD